MVERERLRKDGRERIVRAFVRMLQTRDIGDIPVKALIHEARVSRSTFYYQFSCYDDIAYQLMEDFVNFMRCEIAPVSQVGSEANASGEAQAATVRILTFVESNSDVFRAILRSSRGDEFRRRLVDTLYKAYCALGLEFYLHSGDDARLTEAENAYYLYMQAHSLLSCLEMWCERDFAESPQELLDLFVRFAHIAPERSSIRRA